MAAKSSPVITLLTDFGLDDEYVGVMKGVILSILPGARIVDITHGIDPQDTLQAAMTLQAAYRYFPKGSIHVIVVDPGVGTRRNVIAADARGHIFLAPDNGVLWPVIEENGVEKVIIIKESAFFLSPVCRTFHGRDIFAPVAAHLAKGTKISNLGPPILAADIVRLELPKTKRGRDGSLVGSIIGLDRFGNLMTNMTSEDINASAVGRSLQGISFQVKKRRIKGLSRTYTDANKGDLLALFSSRGFLEIAACRGNAARILNVKRGDSVRVFLPRTSSLLNPNGS